MAANPRKTQNDSISLWHPCVNSESVGSCGTVIPSLVCMATSLPRKERSSPFQLSPCESHQTDTIPRLLGYGWEMTTEKQSCAAQQGNTRRKKSRWGAEARVRCLFWGWEGCGRGAVYRSSAWRAPGRARPSEIAPIAQRQRSHLHGPGSVAKWLLLESDIWEQIKPLKNASFLPERLM